MANSTSRGGTAATAADTAHLVRTDELKTMSALERLRLLGTPEDGTTDLALAASCHCGWNRITWPGTEATVTAQHQDRDPHLPVHRIGAASLIGTRARNADSWASAVDDTTGRAAFAVADGLGNRTGAAEAAALAASTAVTAALNYPKPAQALLDASLQLDHYRPGGDDGDTVMVLATTQQAAGAAVTWDIAWVGDCRAYILNHNGLYLLTRDHTRGQRLRDAGVADEIAQRADHIVYTTVRHSLTDPGAIGTSAITNVGRLLLVSDGISKALPDDMIEDALTEFTDPQTCATELAHLGALDQYADNATAVVIDTSLPAWE